jgi:sugar phosphate isomerase/epimerase
MHDRSFIIERNLKTISELLPTARDCGVGLMIENLPGEFNSVLQLSQLLDPIPELVCTSTSGTRTFSCNETRPMKSCARTDRGFVTFICTTTKGGNADLHLPLGSGTLDLHHHIRLLRSTGTMGPSRSKCFPRKALPCLQSRCAAEDLERSRCDRDSQRPPIVQSACCD